jgi:amidase
VPATIKVNADQAGYATTNGLRLQKDLIAQEDSPVVANLRKAGAVILGRTNTPAFSLRWFTRNSLHGHTKNPRDASITPGGSSGGAAAAVAPGSAPSRMARISAAPSAIRPMPAACTGCGRRSGASRRGTSRARNAMRAGSSWRCRGRSREPSATCASPSPPWRRATSAILVGRMPMEGPPVPKRAALCLSPDGLAVQPAVADALRDAARRLEAAGWAIEETDTPPLREPAALQAMLWLAESRRGLNAALHREADPDASFVFSQMEALCPQPDLNAFMDGLQKRATFVRQWMEFFERFPVAITPVSAELPFRDQEDVESPEAFHRIMEAQLTQIGVPLMGLPGLVVTTGLVGTVPVGVQLLAGRYREDVLLQAGALIEAAGVPPAPVDPA